MGFPLTEETASVPPRVRGKAAAERKKSYEKLRSLACAGKSTGCSCVPSPPRDHPRVCGEKPMPSPFPLPSWGSPPRVRGKVARLVRLLAASRITPACAGKSRRPGTGQAAGRDHPRVCGEKNLILQSTGNGRGSPPRVRGKVPNPRLAQFIRRITPACAGKRPLPAARVSGYWDHPRVCGEKLLT